MPEDYKFHFEIKGFEQSLYIFFDGGFFSLKTVNRSPMNTNLK